MNAFTEQQIKERKENLDKLNNGIFFENDSMDQKFLYKFFDDGSLRIRYQVYFNGTEPIFKDGDDGFHIVNQKELIRLANANESWYKIDDRRSSWHW